MREGWFVAARLMWVVAAAAFGFGTGHTQEEGTAAGDDEPELVVYPPMPKGWPPVRPVEGAEASTEAEMKPYTEPIPGAEVSFEMLPVKSGKFLMGSPEDEEDRDDDSEGPVHEVQVEAFWMGKYEVTWDEYHLFMSRLDIQYREQGAGEAVENDKWADAVSRPTPPYVPMDFEMGVSGFPAICMTQFAAKQYTMWLSLKTGRFYRLPSEAEWEYVCRAGTTTAYSFGDDVDDLEDYGWFFDNAEDTYQKPGQKKPNPWGFYDMHGNVAEWVLDSYDEEYYGQFVDQTAVSPINWPTKLYPRVVRGGSWDDDAELLRSASRVKSRKSWKVQDPQLPKSIWYHTDARGVGFRLVRPLVVPPMEERMRFWEADLEDVREIQEKQRSGGR